MEHMPIGMFHVPTLEFNFINCRLRAKIFFYAPPPKTLIIIRSHRSLGLCRGELLHSIKITFFIKPYCSKVALDRSGH